MLLSLFPTDHQTLAPWAGFSRGSMRRWRRTSATLPPPLPLSPPLPTLSGTRMGRAATPTPWIRPPATPAPLQHPSTVSFPSWRLIYSLIKLQDVEFIRRNSFGEFNSPVDPLQQKNGCCQNESKQLIKNIKIIHKQSTQLQSISQKQKAHSLQSSEHMM